MISSHRIPPIKKLHIIKVAIPRVHQLEMGKEETKKATKRHGMEDVQSKK